MRLSIDAIGAGGDGVTAIQGGRVFTPLTAPGDVVDADVVGDRGELVEVLSPSDWRAAPPCRYFGVCGGCALQHIDEARYREWKASRVAEALRLGGIEVDDIAPVMTTPVASRRRAAFTFRRENGRVRLGFKKRRSREVCFIDACLVLEGQFSDDLEKLSAVIEATGAERGLAQITACDNGYDVNIAKAGDILEEPHALARLAGVMASARVNRVSVDGETALQTAAPIVRFDGLAVTPPPGAFLQASKAGQAALIELVKAAAGQARNVVDLFSGCGAFSLPLARTATVTAFDSDAPAIDALSAAARAHGAHLKPLRAQRRNLFMRPLEKDELDGVDCAVIDPPRAGAAEQADRLARAAVPTVVSVSCNPATFARDAVRLVEGGYELTQVTPVDQFVYSPHIELVGVFRRR